MNTKKTNHTPGPWKILKGNGVSVTISNGESHLFPVVWSESAYMDVAYVVPMNDTKHGDASLIAAAPDLLRVAHLVATLNEKCLEIGEGRMIEMVTTARAAIAKAEGKSCAK